MTTYNSKTAARKMLTILCLIIMFFSFMSIACDDGGDIQEAGQDVVNSVTFERTQAEQNVINMLQETCSQSAECAAHQLP